MRAEVPETELRPADDGVLVRRLCWPGPADVDVVGAVLDGGRLAGVWDAAGRARVAGVVAHQLLTDKAAARALDEGEHEMLLDELRVGHSSAVACRAHGVEVLAALDAAGVPAAAVYGLAAESRIYQANGSRAFDGIDVLVAPSTLPVARDVLDTAGYSEGGTCWRRPVEHPTLDHVVVNLVERDYLDATTVGAVLSRCVAHPLPVLGQALAVPTAADALVLALAQIGSGLGRGGRPADWRAHLDVLRWRALAPAALATLPRSLVVPVRDGLRAMRTWSNAAEDDAMQRGRSRAFETTASTRGPSGG